MKNVIYVKDGDNVSVIVKLEPSASDPFLAYPEIAMVYRVVANSFGPTFELVPLGPKPVLLKESSVSRVPADHTDPAGPAIEGHEVAVVKKITPRSIMREEEEKE